VIEERPADGSRFRHEERRYPPWTIVRSCFFHGNRRCRTFTQGCSLPKRDAPSDLHRAFWAVHVAGGESRKVVGRGDTQRAVRRHQLRKGLPIEPARIR
jgi:hypothetical protein